MTIKINTENHRAFDSGSIAKSDQTKNGTQRMRAMVMIFGRLNIDFADFSIRFDLSAA
jgi:hypothetical protein